MPLWSIARLVVAACGGSTSSSTQQLGSAPPAGRRGAGHDGVRPERRLPGGRAPRSRARTAARRSRSSQARREQDLHGHGARPTAATFAFTLDVKDSPNTTAAFAGLVAQGLLRRPDLPPHRPRLRDPGRRPDRHRQGRPGLQHGRQAAPRAPPTRPAWWRWPRRRPSRPARRQPVLRGHRAGRRAAARLRAARQGRRRAWTWCRQIGKLGDPADQTGTGAPRRPW